MSAAKFLKLNDKSQKDSPGKFTGICGETCTHHELTLRAEKPQTVFISAHTWSERGITKQCEGKDNSLYHVAVSSKLKEPLLWNYGDMAFPPIKLEAGEEMKIQLEWNFAVESHPNDWSLVAYGTGSSGTLKLTHDQNLGSD